MILKGRSRADGGKLATYLLSSKNEQVRVLDIRGTVTDDQTAEGLRQSLKDFDELGKMTKGKTTLFHLAINPDDRDRMTPEDWQHSIAKTEKALGLEGQPRAVVSHTKDGKEHYHVVWSRVNVETRKCVQMSFSNLKLCSTAREIEIDLGLKQTPQRARGAHRLKQHVKDIQQQQDSRSRDPRAERNQIVQGAWELSGNGEEFKAQVESAGYQLAIGRRGVLLMDSNNEPHSIARCVGIKEKDVREKLGDLEGLPTVEELREQKTRTTDTEETKAPEPIQRQARDLTASEVQELLTASSENATPEATARRATTLAPEQIEAALKRYERMPWQSEEEWRAEAVETATRIASDNQDAQPERQRDRGRSY